MDILQSFIRADMLKLKVSGSYSLKLGGLVNQGGTFEAPDAVCLPKPRGALDVTLVPSEFNLPQLKVPLHLNGVIAGEDNSGRPRIRCLVNQDNINLYLPDYGATIQNVHGEVTLILGAVSSPKPDDGCGGDSHSHVVSYFVDPSSERSITAAIRKDPFGGTLSITGLSIVGSAAVPIDKPRCGIVNLRLANSGGSGCKPGGAIEGGIARIVADFNDFVLADDATIKWDIFGASKSPQQPDPTQLLVNIPSPVQEFTVTLTVSMTDCVRSARITVRPKSLVEAQFEELLCNFQMTRARWQDLIKPPSPERDFSLPMSNEQLQMLNDTVRALSDASRQVSVLSADMLNLLSGHLN